VGLLAVAGVTVCAMVAVVLRWCGLAWSWALPALVAVPVAILIGWQAALGYGAAAIAAVGTGVYLHVREVLAGGDLATRARQRRGITDAPRARVVRRRITDREWATDDGVAVGQDRTGAAVRIPVCGSRAAMILAAGATGSGKTVTMALMALAAIRRGFGVVVVDPKPDDFLWKLLDDAARRAGRRLTVWSPDGGSVYNPYQVGTDTEIVDKILSTETFTEPHYQRLAQRYLGHVVRSLRAAEITVSLATIHQYMQPARLSALARELPDEKRLELLDYLETLTAQQERDLAGTRDRLAILAESDVRDWLDPRTAGEKIDLRASLENGDIVLFRLDSDRRPLATGMLASAVIQDLVAISADRQHGDHRPGLVLIDEFSAIAAKEVARLFSRARGAQLSVVLGTQELADLEAVLGALSSGGIRDRILGNLDVLVS
ncbi:MAG: type IV secretory system conjugative DNA transfer family protein, partial [Solirubrobacterales bacterium]